MNNLTDKLEAEKLYYVKNKSGDICIRQAHLFSTLKTERAIPFVDFDDDVVEVLAPVPSYDELLKLESDSLAKEEGEEIIAELENELEKLKEDIHTGRCYLEK